MRFETNPVNITTCFSDNVVFVHLTNQRIKNPALNKFTYPLASREASGPARPLTWFETEHEQNITFPSKADLNNGTGVVQNMRQILHKNFPEIDEQITYFMARLFTYTRLNQINRNAKLKNAKTLRSKKKLAQLEQK